MKLTPKQLRQIINEELTRALLEDRSLEQLELPGIPPANPKRYEASLATAKLILPDVLAGKKDVLVHLAYAAPRVVKGLEVPLDGIRSAATRLMMDYNVDVDEDIAQEILSILKRHPTTEKLIDRIINTMKTATPKPGYSLGDLSVSAAEKVYLQDTIRHADYAAQEQGLAQDLSYLDEKGMNTQER